MGWDRLPFATRTGMFSSFPLYSDFFRTFNLFPRRPYEVCGHATVRDGVKGI
jgi:hypothetical protein